MFQHKLEAALLALGQFQHALSELQAWLNHTHTTLDTQRPVSSDPKAIEIELAKHHVCFHLLQNNLYIEIIFYLHLRSQTVKVAHSVINYQHSLIMGHSFRYCAMMCSPIMPLWRMLMVLVLSYWSPLPVMKPVTSGTSWISSTRAGRAFC